VFKHLNCEKEGAVGQERRAIEGNVGGEYNQSVLYTCIKCHNKTIILYN
jgi:hypothetical protein